MSRRAIGPAAGISMIPALRSWILSTLVRVRVDAVYFSKLCTDKAKNKSPRWATRWATKNTFNLKLQAVRSHLKWSQRDLDICDLLARGFEMIEIQFFQIVLEQVSLENLLHQQMSTPCQ